jgi:hypothetical protein
VGAQTRLPETSACEVTPANGYVRGHEGPSFSLGSPRQLGLDGATDRPAWITSIVAKQRMRPYALTERTHMPRMGRLHGAHVAWSSRLATVVDAAPLRRKQVGCGPPAIAERSRLVPLGGCSPNALPGSRPSRLGVRPAARGRGSLRCCHERCAWAPLPSGRHRRPWSPTLSDARPLFVRRRTAYWRRVGDRGNL